MSIKTYRTSTPANFQKEVKHEAVTVIEEKVTAEEIILDTLLSEIEEEENDN